MAGSSNIASVDVESLGMKGTSAMSGSADRLPRLMWPWFDRKQRFSSLKAITFALMFAPAIWIIHQVATGEFGPVPLGGMTYWSGVWATALLLLALAITPALTILRWGRLVIIRRMIGVTALAYTVAHIFIYFALRFWNFASIAHEMLTRLSLIIASVATAGLIVLGATSFDAMVQRMGLQRWQRLHSAVYALTGLALVHYLLSPDVYAEQYLLSGIFFWLMGWRLLKSRGQATDAKALAVLAVASCLFTLLLQVVWLWAYQGYTPLETLADNFTLMEDLAPAWKVLTLGFLVAIVGALRRTARLQATGSDVS
jgi:methionine sulfoxide reductase heme-binding subunit